MNLLNIRKRVRSLIREPRENFLLDSEIADWANDASFEATKDINYPWKNQIIYGVADQSDYTLATDFHSVHPLLNFMFNNQKLDKYGVKWMEKEYPNYLTASSVTQPEQFYFKSIDEVSIFPPPKLVASGTDTTGGGAAVLNDSAASFSSDYVGHAIQNTTDSSYGLITAVASTTQLTAALTGGTNGYWDLADAYTINLSGNLPYVYKEDDMAEDIDESKVAAKFPYLIIYRILPMAEVKCFRAASSSASKEINRTERWEQLYQVELAKAKNTIHKYVRGHHSRTIPPGEW